jgi:hypothetical protein
LDLNAECHNPQTKSSIILYILSGAFMNSRFSWLRNLFDLRPDEHDLIVYVGGQMWLVREVRKASAVMSIIEHLKISNTALEVDSFEVVGYWYLPKGEIKFGPALGVQEG